MAGYREVEAALNLALEPIAEREGFELVAVFVSGPTSNPTVAVLLDREGGVNLDVLAGANAWIEPAIEASALFTGAYTLEVSSPGIDRPLRKREDYARFAGSEVVIKTPPSPGERAVWRGRLEGITGDTVVVTDDRGERLEIEFDHIVGAHLKGIVDFSGNGRK